MEYATDPEKLNRDRAALQRNADERAAQDAKRLKAQNELAGLTGEDSIDHQKSAKRAELAKRELASIDAKLRNLDRADAAAAANEKGNPQQTYDSTASARLQLEAHRHQLDGLIKRGGVDAPDQPFNRDQVGSEIAQAMRDARDAHAEGLRLARRSEEIRKGSPLTDEEKRRQAAGADYDPEALRRRAGQAFRREETDNQTVRELQSRFKYSGRDHYLQNLQETPGSKQDQQFGTNTQALSEAAKSLGKAGYDIAAATKDLRSGRRSE